MDVEKALKGLDELYRKNRIDLVEAYLTDNIVKAMEEEDSATVLSLLNELVGFCRDSNQYEKSLTFGRQALELIRSEGLSGTVYHATTLVNTANAQRAAGRLTDAVGSYREAEAIYLSKLPPEAFEFASVYNNLSLVYMEAGDYEPACACLEKALGIVELHREGNDFEYAVTCANLGNCLLQMSKRKEDRLLSERAAALLARSEAVFDGRSLYDTHYAAAVMGLGEIRELSGDLQGALYKYITGMEAIRNNFGHTDFYYRVKQRYDRCLGLLKKSGASYRDPLAMKGLEICREYCDQVVLPSFAEHFPGLKDRIAMGLKGPGSDCYGFDDAISRDHDWGPDVCIWIGRADLEGRGGELRAWYETLPDSFMGFRRVVTATACGRRGILDFDSYLAMLERDYGNGEYRIGEHSENALSLFSNGELFYDPSGMFDRVAAETAYTRQNAAAVIAYDCRSFSQKLQYNFRRMALRGDMFTACQQLVLGGNHALHMVHAMNLKYAPHDKWLVHSASLLPFGGGTPGRLLEIKKAADALEDKDIREGSLRPVMGMIDALAVYLMGELKKTGFLKGDSDLVYMEDAAGLIVCE